MKTKILFVNVLLALFIIGCSNPENAFQKAMNKNTIDALEKFVTKHPDSEQSKEARTRIYALAYDDALQKNTIEAFNEYLNKYRPDSVFTQKAKMNVCSLKFKEAHHTNTIQSYENFIKDCPESLETDSAMMMLRALRPVAGTWAGNDIQFNISQDGKTICKQDSKLVNTCSITLKIRTAGYTMEIYIYEEIEIRDNGSFSLRKEDTAWDSQSGYITIEGEFSSTSEVSGKFTLTDYGRDKINGSTDWKANPEK